MEVLNNEAQQEAPKRTHESQMREFAGKLNEILSEGYSLPAVLTVLEAAVFEMRFSLYMSQVEAESQQLEQRRIEIPQMKIPTNKGK